MLGKNKSMTSSPLVTNKNKRAFPYDSPKIDRTNRESRMTHNQFLHIAGARFSSDTERVRYPPCANPLHIMQFRTHYLQFLRIKDLCARSSLVRSLAVRSLAYCARRKSCRSNWRHRAYATYLLHERLSQISNVPGNTTTSQSNSRKIFPRKPFEHTISGRNSTQQQHQI